MTIMEISQKENENWEKERLILKVVARHFHVQAEDIVFPSYISEEIEHAKRFCMCLYKEVLDIPLRDIMRIFGKKDHTTVMYCVERVKSELEADNVLKETMHKILYELKEADSYFAEKGSDRK